MAADSTPKQGIDRTFLENAASTIKWPQIGNEQSCLLPQADGLTQMVRYFSYPIATLSTAIDPNNAAIDNIGDKPMPATTLVSL